MKQGEHNETPSSRDLRGTRENRHAIQSTMKNTLLTRVPWRLDGLRLLLGCLWLSCAVVVETRGDDNSALFEVSLSDCGADNITTFAAAHGSIQGFVESDFANLTTNDCAWKLEVPAGPFVFITIDWVTHRPCLNRFHLTLSKLNKFEEIYIYAKFSCFDSPKIFLETQTVYFRFNIFEAIFPPPFKISFETATENAFTILPIQYTSDTSGFVTSPGYSSGRSYPCHMNASRQLSVPAGHVVMISLARYHAEYRSEECSQEGLEIFSLFDSGERRLVLKKCDVELRPAPAQVLNTSLLVRFVSVRSCEYYNTGFKMLFSILPEDRAPPQLPSGLFDCSVPHYASFKQHLHCNLEPECAGGEDEGGHCPFSSPACNGSVAVGNKCYEWVRAGFQTSWLEAQSICKSRGWDLAMMKTRREWEALHRIYQVSKHHLWAWIGLRVGGSPLPALYSKAILWADGTVAHGLDIRTKFGYSSTAHTGACGYLLLHPTPMVRFYVCVDGFYFFNFICENVVEPDNLGQTRDREEVVFPELKDPLEILGSSRQRSLISCPEGHVTHDFLACDPASRCWLKEYSLPCQVPGSVLGQTVITEMFDCDDNGTTVPHNLVCDFRRDCGSGSDESFCQRTAQCPGFTCTNGQCLAAGEQQRCDGVLHCLDGSDEECARSVVTVHPPTYAVLPPVVVSYDKHGNETEQPLNATGSCPDTHFRCPGDGYCLPVYLRCNGMFDCPGHEDEAGCERFFCPGFYRCRGSAVCLHAEHLCDGWPQCPQNDDELFCQKTCPPGCHCQGWSFICKRPFLVKAFSDLRYLDATGSGMSPRDVVDNSYLMWLRLASCRLRYVTQMALPHLRTLDLGHNELTSLDLDLFLSLPSLRDLRLSGNPLTLLVSTPTDPHSNLRSVDLSYTKLLQFHSEAFISYPHIKRLNLSFSSVDTISDEFTHMGNLEELDLRGSPLRNYPRTLLVNLSHLTAILSDDYRLCCEENLPAGFSTAHCHAPADVISSCEDLLRSDVHRALLWAFCLLTTVGNSACLAVRLFVRKTALSNGFNILVTNLNLADLLMGVYLALIGAGDFANSGRYLSFEEPWLSSAACQAAGFLFVVSREMSVFLVCLLIADRMLHLRFPTGRFLLHTWSPLLSCGVAWAVSVFLAAVPALLWSQWEVFGQNGLCVPLPFAGKAIKGRDYALAVVVFLNFLLSLLSAIGETFLLWLLSTSSAEAQKSQEMMAARRVTTIVASHCLCWLLIGLLGLLGTSLGGAVAPDLALSIVTLALPLNPAFNPCLYAVHMLAEKRRKGREWRLRRKMERAREQVTQKSCLGSSDVSVSRSKD